MDTQGIHHIVLTVSDMVRSQRFYGDVLGFEVKQLPPEPALGVYAGAYLFMVGDVEVFLVQHKQTPDGDRFSEFRIGLDHVSFKAPSEQALYALAEKLMAAGVPTNGVEVFEPVGVKYVSFRDPDDIQLEYWLG